MANIFVITASNSGAKTHIHDTIENPISAEKVEKHFVGDELDTVKGIGQQSGYYAWGTTPGKRDANKRKWDRIEIGDYILVYQDKVYTYYSRVVFKAHNRNFSLDNWGTDELNNTWEYMYLLEKPKKIDPPISALALSEYLPDRYMGFIRIADDSLQNILQKFGSVDNFISEQFLSLEQIHSGFPQFWWVNQGITYNEEDGIKYIRAPKQDKAGGYPNHWRNVTRVKKGDVIFHYSDGFMRGISIAAADPADLIVEKEAESWNKEQVRCDILHYKLDELSIKRIKPHKSSLDTALEGKNGPFDINGDIKQGYLFELGYPAARIIRGIYGRPFPEEIEKYFSDLTKEPPSANELLMLLTKKKQIILYGPPGTGKTFSTRQLSTELLKG